MTDREKAIVMAHTGICMLEGEKMGVFYQYLNELYGRPVYTHEWVTLDIKEKSKPDFLQLCKKEEPERKNGKWIMHIDDTISRQAAIDALERIFNRCEEIEAHLPDGDLDKTGYKMFPDYMTVWKYLRQLPSAERRGAWVGIDDEPCDVWECDQCGNIVEREIPPKYCEECGARMVEE